VPAVRAPALVLGALCLLAVAAAGVLVQTERVTTSPSAAAPPLTLAAGATGTTTLGSSATSASTSKTGLAATAAEVLLVKKGSASYDVRIRLDSVSGFGALDTATVELVLGASTQVQDVVGANGAITQSVGTAIPLPAGGSDMSVKVLGTKLSGGTSTLSMTILLAPTGASVPALSYSYTLRIT